MKSYFGLNKMLFFGIVFVLYFLELSEKSGFWKTAIIHIFRGREGASHDVNLIIGGGYLMMMLDYKAGRRVQNYAKK